MALDFPSSPTEGQVFNVEGLPNYIYRSGVWSRNYGTASPYNRIINPSFLISQQNGNTAVTTNGAFPTDMWLVSRSAGLTATFSTQRVQVLTPQRSANRLRTTITAIQDPLAAGDWLGVLHRVEGNRLIDLQWATANAVPVVLRFGMKAPTGTYGVTIRSNSSPAYYSYGIPVTVPAGSNNIDVEYEFSIPGSTNAAGWNTDNTSGMEIWFTLATGTSQQGTPLTWRASSAINVTGASNGAAALNTFEIFDVGLYADPNNTGVAPQFQQPDLEDDLLDCQRYWYPAFAMRGIVSAATVCNRATATHPVPMRATPSLSLVGAAFRIYDGNNAPNVTSIANVATDAQHLEMSLTASAGAMTVGRGCGGLADAQEAQYIACSARL